MYTQPAEIIPAVRSRAQLSAIVVRNTVASAAAAVSVLSIVLADDGGVF